MMPKKVDEAKGLTSRLARTLQEHPCEECLDHADFIPFKDFKMEDLPEGYRTQETFNFFKEAGKLTVRIVMYETSQHRPEKDKYYDLRGTKARRVESGRIMFVERLKDSKEPCPCRECKKSDNRKAVAIITIKTAKHVVFDSDEASKTIIDVFYDDESFGGVERLYGTSVVCSDEEMDSCDFICKTHNEKLAGELENVLKQLKELRMGAETKSASSLEFPIIISHPHGYCKHISIGKERSNPIVVGTDVIWTLHESDKIVGGDPKSAEITGLEILVQFPNGREEKHAVWQLDRPVKDTKEWILNMAGVEDPPPNALDMVIELPADEKQVMKDGQDIMYYWDDLTLAIKVTFRPKVPGPQHFCCLSEQG